MFLKIEKYQRKLAIQQPVTFTGSNRIKVEIKPRPSLCDFFFVNRAAAENLDELAVEIVIMRRYECVGGKIPEFHGPSAKCKL